MLVSEVDSNGEKIGSLEITTGNISTKVSSVEKNLSTTNTNLSNLSGKVDTLSNDINGVSADFEDFKDNEYIQSIDNLQKQIDGAIQFWNGAEIPTINNYPANQWTTENDKINHQADIYTVVQDVQGEMKQGKSYRFDKVNGVWKWIELTDNELSAVQAIAQEALNKANANATEIGTVKTRVSSLEQTDKQIKASVESIDKQIIPTASVSGSNIYIEDASDNPLVKLEIEGKSKQVTRSGKNNFDEEKAKKSSNYTANTSIGSNWYALTIDLLPNTEYTITRFANNVSTNGAFDLQFYLYEDTKNPLFYVNNATAETVMNRKTVTFTTRESGKIYLAHKYGNDERLTNLFNNIDIQIEKGNISTEYEQYGVMPSPDFPSEIESVGYENEFDVETWVNSGNNSNYYSYANDVLSVNALDDRGLAKFTEDEKVYLPNGTYYIGNNGSAGVRIYNDNTDYPITQAGKFEVTLGYIYLKFVSSTVITCQPMINKGSKEHSYIPYGKYGIEVETVGKNLFDYISNFNYSVSGLTNTINDDGSITVSGIPTANYVRIVPITDITNRLKNGTTYKMLQTNNANEVFLEIRATNRATGTIEHFYQRNSSFVANTITYTYDISLVTNTKEVWGTTSKAITGFFQLEEETTSTKFEKYKSNKLVIELDEPLRSIGDIKDIAYIRNNKLYVDRYVGSTVLNGSENWKQATTTPAGTARFYYENNDIYNNYVNPKSKEIYVISDRFVGIDWFGIYQDDKTSKNLISNYNDTTNATSRRIVIRIDITYASTIEEFKTWLSTHNTQVDYELATPVTEEYGEIEMPSTFKGVNHISTTDELEPTLNIEYVRDTTLSNYVEGQINKVMTIEERHYSELVIEDNSIKESVESVNSSLNGLNTTINRVEEITTDNSQVINVISTNIDKTSGEVREVTTTTGFTFNADGMTIDDGSGFKAQHRSNGTYYKDGESIVGQYTKDGSKQKDL